MEAGGENRSWKQEGEEGGVSRRFEAEDGSRRWKQGVEEVME